MRIAILGKWHRYPSYYLHGMLEGFIRNGHQAMAIEFIDAGLSMVETALRIFKPNLVFCHMLFSDEGNKSDDKIELLLRLKKSLGFRVYHQLGDPRLLPRWKKEVEGGLKDVLDGILIAHKEWEAFSSAGVQLIYFPYGTLKMDFQELGDIKYKLVFMGTYPSDSWLYQKRTRFLTRLKEYDLITFPSPDQDNTTFITSEIARRTAAFVNILGDNTVKGFLSLRPFQFIGAGCLSFQMRLDEIDDIFIDKEHHLVFDDYDENQVMDLYRYYCEKKRSEGEKIKRQGYAYCQEFHNYQVRTKDLLEVLDGKREKVRYKLEDFK